MSKKPIYVTWNSTINNFQLDARVGNDSGASYVAVRFAKSLLNRDELIEKSSAQSKAWEEYKENLTVYLVSRASKFEPKEVEVREELFNFLQGEDTKSGYYIGKADHFRTRGGYLFGIELGVAPSLEFPVRVDDIANDALEYTEIFWNPELKAPSLAEYELISFGSISGLYNRESETKTLQLTQVDKETYELIERDIKFRNKLEIRTDNAPDLKAGNGRATITLNFSGINVLDVDGVPAEFSAKNATLTCRRFGAETLDVLTNVTSVSSRTITYTVDDLSTIGSLLLDFTTASPHQYNSIDEFTIAIKIDRNATSSMDGDVSSPPAVVPPSQPKEEIYLDWKDIEYSNNSYTLEYETPEPAPYIIVRANLTLTNRSELIERAEGNGYTLSAYRDVLTIYLDGVEDNTVDNVFDFSSEPDSKTVTLLLEGEKFHKSGAYIFDFNTKDFDTFVTPTWTKGSINESVTMIMAELPWDQSRGVPRLEDFVLRDASELDTLYPRAGSEGVHKFHLREVEESRYSIELSNVKFKDGLLFDTNNIPAFASKDGNFDVTVNVTLRGLTVKGPGFKSVINNEYNMTGGFVVDNNPKTAFAPTATLEEGTFTVTEDKSKFKSNMLFYVNGVSSDRQYTSIDYIKVEAVLVEKAAPPSEETPPAPPSEEPPPSNESGNDSSPPSTGGGSSQPKKEVKIRWSNAEFNTYYQTIAASVHPSSNYIVVQASLSLKNYDELLNSARDRDLTIGNFKDNLTIGLYDKDHGKFADLFSFANGKTEQTVTFIAEASRFRKNPSTVTFSFRPLEYDTYFNPSWGTSGDINENIKIKIADFAWPHSEVPTLDGVELIDIGVVLDQYISNPYGHKYYLSELSPLHYAIELQDLKFKDSVIISAEQVADYTSLSNDHIITLKASVRNVKVRDEDYKEISDGRYGLIGEFKPGIGVDPLFHYTAELDSADQTLELEKTNVWNREIFKLSSSFGSPQYNDVGYLKVEVIVKKKEEAPPPPKEPEPPTDNNTGDVQPPPPPPPPPPPSPPDTGDSSDGSGEGNGESEAPPDTEVPDESEEPFVPPKITITDPREIVLYQDLHALLTALDYHTGKNIPNLRQPILEDPEHVSAREAFKSELLQLAGSEWTNHNNYFFKSLESFNYQLLHTRFGIEQFKDPHNLVNHSLYSTTVEDIKSYALTLLYRFYKFYAGQVLDKDWGPSPFNTIEAIFLNFIEMVKGRDLNEEIMKKVMEKVEKTIKPQSKVNEICSKIEASLLKEMTGGQLRTEVYEYTRIADKVYHRRMPQIQSYFKVTKGFLIELHPTYDEGKFNYFRMRAVHYNLPT